MCGAASTGISLAMSPELSVVDVGTVAVDARISPGVSTGGLDSNTPARDAGPMTVTADWRPNRAELRGSAPEGNKWERPT